MKLALYKIKLAFYLVLFLLKLSANFSSKTKPLILSSFVFCLLLIIGGISLFTQHQKSASLVLSATVIPRQQTLFTAKYMTREEIEFEISKYEKIVAIQPYSRDVLINLSHLYATLGQTEKAKEYKNAAFAIDPNSPLIQ